MLIKHVSMQQSVLPGMLKKQSATSKSFSDALYDILYKPVGATGSQLTTDQSVAAIQQKIARGEKPTTKELMYLKLHAPEEMAKVDAILRERKVMEMTLRLARTKADVDIAEIKMSMSISKSDKTSEEKQVLQQQLKDAVKTYKKTAEYKHKQESAMDETSFQTARKSSYRDALKAYGQ